MIWLVVTHVLRRWVPHARKPAVLSNHIDRDPSQWVTSGCWQRGVSPNWTVEKGGLRKLWYGSLFALWSSGCHSSSQTSRMECAGQNVISQQIFSSCSPGWDTSRPGWIPVFTHVLTRTSDSRLKSYSPAEWVISTGKRDIMTMLHRNKQNCLYHFRMDSGLHSYSLFLTKDFYRNKPFQCRFWKVINVRNAALNKIKCYKTSEGLPFSEFPRLSLWTTNVMEPQFYSFLVTKVIKLIVHVNESRPVTRTLYSGYKWRYIKENDLRNTFHCTMSWDNDRSARNGGFNKWFHTSKNTIKGSNVNALMYSVHCM